MGTVRREFGNKPYDESNPKSARGPVMFIEPYHETSMIEIAMSSGRGWERMPFTPEEAEDIIATIQDAVRRAKAIAELAEQASAIRYHKVEV